MLLWHGKVFDILSLVSRGHFEDVLTSKSGMVMVLETSFSYTVLRGSLSLRDCDSKSKISYWCSEIYSRDWGLY